MEVKVLVNGIPRMVCGVTEDTTCQEVVLALAQASGQPGRYTLREKFKDFERCMTPGERPLETLKKYGEQSKEVQLILQHNGSLTWDEAGRVKVSRYQPCPPLRRKDPGARIRRSSGSLGLHRQSLPPLSCLREKVEQTQEELKKSKRKSLTLMEEAWEWLESLGKGKVYSTAGDKQSRKRRDKRNRASLDSTFNVEKETSDQSSRSKVRGQESFISDLDLQTSCCIGNQTRDRDKKQSKKTQKVKSDSSSSITEEEKNGLRETIVCQMLCLQDLQVLITNVHKQIFELEERQKATRAEEKTQERLAEEQTETITFWEKELKAQERYEKDLQKRFLEMRANAAECKADLEEYKLQMQRFDRFSGKGSEQAAATEVSVGSTEGDLKEQSDSDVNRKFLPREDLDPPPHALVPPNQIKERRLTGPSEIKEWWTRWSESQKPTTEKVIHRSELTIYLGSTKV
uniref:Si:ch211-261n11.3 n=1 Tax=Iconisemion striatum TaxID=60296 RepID=A0A1A7XEK2_9TELE